MSPAGSPSRAPDRIRGLAPRKGESSNAIRGGDVFGAHAWRTPAPAHFTALLVGRPTSLPTSRAGTANQGRACCCFCTEVQLKRGRGKIGKFAFSPSVVGQ